MEIELRPCPFCGGESDYQYEEADAAALWNSRWAARIIEHMTDYKKTGYCANCDTEVPLREVDGVWRYENYCPHCGRELYKEENI